MRLLILFPILLISSALPTPKPTAPKPPPYPVPHAPGNLYTLSAMLQGYVLCSTTPYSPKIDPAITAIQSLRARLYKPAVQDKANAPFCTDLTKSGTAYTAICGPEGTVMRSMDAGKMVNQIYRFCREEVDGVWRVGGVYVFDENTTPVGRMVLYAVGEPEGPAQPQAGNWGIDGGIDGMNGGGGDGNGDKEFENDEGESSDEEL